MCVCVCVCVCVCKSSITDIAHDLIIQENLVPHYLSKWSTDNHKKINIYIYIYIYIYILHPSISRDTDSAFDS